MHKLILIAAISAVVAGCAGGGYAGRGHSDAYRSETGSASDWSQPRYDDRYWPPVDLNSAFPPQIMDGGSQD